MRFTWLFSLLFEFQRDKITDAAPGKESGNGHNLKSLIFISFVLFGQKVGYVFQVLVASDNA